MLPSTIILGFLAPPVASLAAFSFSCPKESLPSYYASTCPGSGMETFLPHPGWRPRAFLPGCSRDTFRVVLSQRMKGLPWLLPPRPI